jgi:hypothetical protein
LRSWCDFLDVIRSLAGIPADDQHGGLVAEARKVRDLQVQVAGIALAKNRRTGEKEQDCEAFY